MSLKRACRAALAYSDTLTCAVVSPAHAARKRPSLQSPLLMATEPELTPPACGKEGSESRGEHTGNVRVWAFRGHCSLITTCALVHTFKLKEWARKLGGRGPPAFG